MSPRKARFDIRQAGRQILTAYLALLAVNVLFYALLVRPRAQTLRTATEESAPNVKRVTDRENQVKSKEAFLSALEKAQASLTTLRDDVLSTRARRMIEVQLELARLAREFGINLQRVQYENQKIEDGALERFAMVVPLEGGYANLRKFLRAVENSDKFLVIEQVGLSTAKDGGALVELNITLATYFGDEEAQAKAVRRRGPGKI